MEREKVGGEKVGGEKAEVSESRGTLIKKKKKIVRQCETVMESLRAWTGRRSRGGSG